eukprot:TRINITY_DN2502_c0_g2_i1.p1 TRINITY_DN2502_c0_g2~~TRINITY_DN2502_c0_g2_i1.p1  ORF type:complete len:581 (+),score=144.40 TRINITY_DN2502_c0_g2_i1:486-2228(+)
MFKLILIGLLVTCLSHYCFAMEGLSSEEDHPSHRLRTDQMAVEVLSSIDADAVARDHGYENLGLVNPEHLPNIYLFRRMTKNERSKRSVWNLKSEEEEDSHPHISTSPHVAWFEEQVASKRWKRAVTPLDPLYSQQWHLHNTNGVDVNVIPVWDRGIAGEGVVIAMVDDGLQRNHPDIAPGYIPSGSYDFNEGDSDPSPHRGDDHGTSAGGVAAARDNNVCGVGSAFRASLSGIRLIADYTTDAQEASGLTYRGDINHIYSNSWGPNDDGRRLEGPGRLTLAAMKNAVTSNRNGKGSLYVWAGGNGRVSGDNCNYDGYANSRFVLTFGAIDYNGKQSYYSESCAALIAVTPSSGSGRSITTTDLLGQAGSSTTDCNPSFGGTSSSAPLAAGVVALLLSANPQLSYRDVQAVLINSTSKNDPIDNDWVANGAGLFVNHKYGYGLVNADKAVQLALNHQLLPEQIALMGSRTECNLPIYDFQPVRSSVTIGENIIVERAEVVFWARHPNRGDLLVKLISPSGTESILAEVHSDTNDNYDGWTFTSLRLWGEQSAGSWSLVVEDRRNLNTGTFTGWQLNIYGH